MGKEPGLHQLSAVGHCRRQQKVVQGAHGGLALSDGCLLLQEQRVSLLKAIAASGIGQVKGKGLIEEQLLRKLCRLLRGYLLSDPGKGPVAGIGEGLEQVLFSVGLSAVALDPISLRVRVAAAAAEMEVLIVRGVLMDILQHRYQLEGGARRVGTLGRPVQKLSFPVILRRKGLPVLLNGIRIKGGL